MADKRLLRRFEELLDCSLRKLLMESRLLLRGEISPPASAVRPSFDLDMPVIQGIKHLAEDVKELVIVGRVINPWSVGLILFFPIHIPELEKRVPVVEGLPEKL